jgi:hypothetical protein
MHLSVRICFGILALTAVSNAAWALATPDFSGSWKQDNDRCQPQRSGDVTIDIQHRDPELTVETTISRDHASPRHAVQRYSTDGKISVSTGVDGDEFHTSIVWKGSDLVFSIEEHEDGRILQSKETWSVIDNGATLERIRERPNGETQALFYRKVPVSCSDSKSGCLGARDK